MAGTDDEDVNVNNGLDATQQEYIQSELQHTRIDEASMGSGLAAGLIQSCMEISANCYMEMQSAKIGNDMDRDIHEQFDPEFHTDSGRENKRLAKEAADIGFAFFDAMVDAFKSDKFASAYKTMCNHVHDVNIIMEDLQGK